MILRESTVCNGNVNTQNYYYKQCILVVKHINAMIIGIIVTIIIVIFIIISSSSSSSSIIIIFLFFLYWKLMIQRAF